MLLRTIGAVLSVTTETIRPCAETRLLIRHSARVHGYRAAKEPYGRACGQDCNEDQQYIGDPGRRGGNGTGGLIDLVDFVALDYLY